MKKQFLFFLSMVVAAAMFPSGLCAENTFYFPYVVNDSETLTELVFTNATAKDAAVTLVAYQEDGTLAATNPSTLTVLANSQVVLSAASLGQFRGWVLGDSNVVGVTGNLRVGSPDRTALDITEPAQAATTILLPFIAHGPGISTEVSLVNPTRYSCKVKMTLYKQDGSALSPVTKVIPPFGMMLGPLSSIFPSDSNFDHASHVIAQSVPMNLFSPVVSIVGFEVVRGFQSSSQGIFARTDLAALAGTPLQSAGQSLVFPHVPTGMNWFSLIGLVNVTGSDVTASLSFVDDAGTLISTPTNPVSVTIAANGSLRKTSKELFSVPDDDLRSGSVQLSNSNLAGFLCVGTIAGSSLAASPAQVTPYSKFLFPAVDETGNSFTGTVLLNPSDSAVKGSMSLVSAQGVTLDIRGFSLVAHQRLVNRIGDKDFSLQGAGQSGGYIFVNSSAPLYAQAFLGVPDKTISTLSPQQTPAEFVPSPQSLFAIGGRISFPLTPDNSINAPVPGISLVLSKGANQISTAVTDSNGEYVFQNLTSGVYSLTPNSTGKTFGPQFREVTLATGNVNHEDFSILDLQVPVVTSITPKETTARYEINSPGERISIYGFGFKASSQVLFDKKTVFDEIPIHTTYVSSTQLVADIPAQALRVGGYYMVQVRNGETEAAGEAVNFLVSNLQPQITYLDPPGLGPDNFPLPELTPLNILGPGPGPVNMEMKINGKDFFPGTAVGISNTVPDIFPAIVPLIGSTPQCILVNGRSPFPIGVRAYDLAGNPIGGISVTFTAPPVVTTAPTGGFPGGTSTVTVVTNGDGFAMAPVFTANPFAGTYVVSAEANIGGYLLTAVFNLTNYLPGETCNNLGANMTYVSSQQIIVHFAIANKGIFSVQVANPSPSGGYSNVRSFAVADGAPGNEPSIISMTPKSVPVGNSDFTLTVGGNEFQSGAWVNFGTERLIPASISSDGTILTVNVPARLLTAAGIVPVTITNPGSSGDTGGTSRRFDFIIKNTPSISSLVPNSIKAGSAGFNLTVTGRNFQSNAQINFGSTTLKTEFADANTLRATVPASLVATPSTVSVTVTNPGGLSDTGGTSSSVSFKVNS